MRIKILFFLLPTLLFAEIGYHEPWSTNQTPEASTVHLSPLGIIAQKGICFYQKFITHITGPRSHFRPTSSQYMLEAIYQYGFLTGYLMGCDRLLRENGDPWVYRSKLFDNQLYKFDPPSSQK